MPTARYTHLTFENPVNGERLVPVQGALPALQAEAQPRGGLLQRHRADRGLRCRRTQGFGWDTLPSRPLVPRPQASPLCSCTPACKHSPASRAARDAGHRSLGPQITERPPRAGARGPRGAASTYWTLQECRWPRRLSPRSRWSVSDRARPPALASG